MSDKARIDELEKALATMTRALELADQELSVWHELEDQDIDTDDEEILQQIRDAAALGARMLGEKSADHNK